MKKKLLLFSSLLAFGAVNAQEQIENSDFSLWGTGNGASHNEEAYNWHSFRTRSGSGLAYTFANANQFHVASGASHDGSDCAEITARSVIGIVANGNMTTGQVNTQSTTASNLNNHNATRNNAPGDPEHNQAFSSRPDSAVYWVNFTPGNGGDLGKATFTLHQDFEYRDPNDGSIEGEVVAKGVDLIPSNGWVRRAVAMDYSSYTGTNEAYMLATFTTNQNPGSGSASDVMQVDNIMMVYNVTTTYSANTCAGATITVPFNANTSATASRVFNVELSDASGSFAAPTVIGTTTIANGNACNGNISCSIPGGQAAGANYKIRITQSEASFASVESASFSIGTAATAGTATPTASTSCTSPNGQIAISGGSGATTYELFDSGNNSQGSNGTGTFTGLTPGDYYVTYVNACGNDNTATVTVGAPSNPTAGTLSGTDVSDCLNPNGSVSLAGSTGTSFELFIAGGASTGQTNGTGDFSGLNAADYEVVVTDANGCTATTNSVTVGNASAPAAPAAGTDATYCEGDPITDLTATAGNGGTLTWYLGGNVEGTGTTLTPSSSVGTHVYTVTETVTNCESSPTTVTVTINPDASAGTGTPTASTSCDTPDGAIAMSGGVADSYELFTSGGTSVGSNATGSFAGLDAGDYYVVATNGCGTDQSATITVTGPSGPTAGTIATVDVSDCQSPNGEVNVTGSNGTSFELFDSGNNSQASNATGMFSGLSAGDYYVVITDGVGCITTTTTETVANNTGHTVSIAPTAQQDLNINETGATLTATESSTATSREWKYTTTSGSGYLSFNPFETNATYDPMFTNVGTYYVVCESVISGCTVMSSEVIIDVTDSTAAIVENTKQEIKVYSFENQVVVNMEGVNLDNPVFKLISLDGRVVLNERLNNGTINQFNTNIPVGIYVFHIVANDGRADGKIMLK